MIFSNRRFVRAVGLMIGSIVGVGVFGLPYAFAQVGWGVGFLLLIVLSGLNAILLLMYTDIVSHTPGDHRLPGNVTAHMGKGWGRLSLFALAIGMWGGMSAYTIAGGRFLSELAGFGNGKIESVLGIAFLGTVALVSYRGLRRIAKSEVFLLGVLLFLFAIIVVSSLPMVRASNLLSTNWDYALLTYGVILFALTGGAGIIPEMRAVLKNDRVLPHAVLMGSLWVFVLYAVVTIVIVAVTGAETSPFAIDALIPLLGDTFRLVGTTLASFSVFSIFLLGSIVLRHTFEYDLSFTKNAAWTAVFVPPAVAYLFGLRSFIDVLGFVGSVLSPVVAIIIVLAYEQMRSSKICRDHACLELPRFVSVVIVVCYSVGIFLTLVHLFT